MSRRKPHKTDPLPGAHEKIKMTGYDLYISARSGGYRVYPDGRIFMENLEPFNVLSDRKAAVRELFDLAARHVQETEETIARSIRQFWADREIDLKKSCKGWAMNWETGELSPPVSNDDAALEGNDAEQS